MSPPVESYLQAFRPRTNTTCTASGPSRPRLEAPSGLNGAQTLPPHLLRSFFFRLACVLVHFLMQRGVNGFTIDNQSLASCYWSVVEFDLGERKHPLKASRLETCIKLKFVLALLLHMCTFVTFNLIYVKILRCCSTSGYILQLFSNLTGNVFH